MPDRLQAAFAHEMQLARQHYRQQDFATAFTHLERAHILGQRQTGPHLLSHLWMLRTGWRRGDRREVLGQLLRLPAALLMTWLWVPLGNSGGANVSALRPMPLPADLAALFKEDRPCPPLPPPPRPRARAHAAVMTRPGAAAPPICATPSAT